jgi:IclR family transcriptional regulator, KDG regulon repressor
VPEIDHAPTTVRAVDRALDILLCFAKSGGELSLSDISKEVGLHKSTVHRLLSSLQSKGFVRKNTQSDKYMLGWSVLELLSNVNQSNDLSTLALPEMTRLRDLTGETVSLYIRRQTERIRVQAIESTEPIRNVVTIGRTYPLFIGASGKVLLAFSDPSLVDVVLCKEDIPSDFIHEEFLAQLDKIRCDGYAISIQERDKGAAAIAAPIFGHNRECVSALSISGPVSRFTIGKMSEYVDTLLSSAAWITKLLSR